MILDMTRLDVELIRFFQHESVAAASSGDEFMGCLELEIHEESLPPSNLELYFMKRERNSVSERKEPEIGMEAIRLSAISTSFGYTSGLSLMMWNIKRSTCQETLVAISSREVTPTILWRSVSPIFLNVDLVVFLCSISLTNTLKMSSTSCLSSTKKSPPDQARLVTMENSSAVKSTRSGRSDLDML